MLIVGESGNFFNFTCGNGKSSEDGANVGTLLHRDDSKLVLFVYPDKESLLIVVENASSLRPVSVETACIKESISLFKEEVIGNQLLLLGFRHGAERIKGSFKFTFKSAASLDNFLLNLISLFSCNSWAKWIVS